ncbi:MAG: DUF2520 domain-containing protein [Acidimicrobiia bacterium]
MNGPGVLALVGPGRAGATVAFALVEQGWKVSAVAGRTPTADSTLETATLLQAEVALVPDAASGADLVIVATPDAAVADTAARAVVAAEPGALMIHLAGSLGLAAFHGAQRFRSDVRYGALHPLISIPSVQEGIDRLSGGWAAVAGDPQVEVLARSIGLHPFPIADADRPRYHAAAAVAANHLVALLGQVERLARLCDVPFESFLPLVRSAVDNAAELGPRSALTGPVSRGDAETVATHLASLPDDELDTYRALAREAMRLSGRYDDLMAAVLFGDDELPDRITEYDSVPKSKDQEANDA